VEMQSFRLFLLFQKYALYLPQMKKKLPQKRVQKAVSEDPPLNVQQEQFLQKTQTAVFLYMFQDGEVYVMNSISLPLRLAEVIFCPLPDVEFKEGLDDLGTGVLAPFRFCKAVFEMPYEVYCGLSDAVTL